MNNIEIDDNDPEAAIKKTLMEEFEKECSLHLQEILDKVAAARRLLAEATGLSEKYAIPFYSSISPLGQMYKPKSFNKKYPQSIELEDRDFLYELTQLGDDIEVGWQHSRVC